MSAKFSKRLVFLVAAFGVAFLTGALLFRGSWSTSSTLESIYTAGLEALARSDYATVRQGIRSLRDRPGAASYASLLSAAYQLKIDEPEIALRELAAHHWEGADRRAALMLSGECLYRRHDLAAAQSCFGQVATESPDFADAHRWLAAVYYDLGANLLARKHLNKFAELRPDDPSPFRLLGLIARDTGDHKTAIANYRLALDRNPPSEVRIEVMHELAQSLTAQLDYQGALEVLESTPANGPIQALKARCFLGLGELEAAERSLRLAETECQNEPQFLLLRARLAIERNRYHEAAKDAQRARQLDPQNPEILYVLSIVHQKLGHLDESRLLMKQSVANRELVARLVELSREAEVHTRDADVRDELAEVCSQLGRSKLAQMWRQAADACRRANVLEAPP